MRCGGEQAGRRVVSALATERRRRTQLRAFLSRLGFSDMPTHRRLTLLLTATLASPLLVYLAIASARAEAFVTAGLSAIAAATIPSALALRAAAPSIWMSRLAGVLVVATAISALAQGSASFPLLWVAALPLPMIFCFGLIEGSAWSAVVLLMVTMLPAGPRAIGVPSDAPIWPAGNALFDFYAAFILVTGFGLAFEALRRNAERRLAGAQKNRAEQEVRMREFSRIASDLLFELDADLRVIALSGAGAKLLRLTDADIRGVSPARLVTRTTRFAWRDLAERMRQQAPIQDKIIDLELRNGVALTLRVRAEPRFDDRNRFLGYRGAAVDRTERRRAEIELREKDRALQHATRMEAVGQLTSGVAHDFNNLLTVIQGNVSLLIADSGASSELDQIDRAAQSAADLTKKLLAYSRRSALRPQAVNVADLLFEEKQLLGAALPETIAIRTEVDAGVGACHADRTQLESALLNLALNARDAMREGGQLVIAAALDEVNDERAERLGLKPGVYVRVDVRDTGSGMSQELLEHVCEPFFTTKPSGEGTGLGLSMAYGFARQSDGALMLDSALGKGTTASIFLPQGTARTSKPAAETPSLVAGAHARRALLVEDQQTVRFAISRLLERLGYEVLVAESAAAALAGYAEGGIDVVVSDIVLAGSMDGVELISMLRERERALPSVLMSGYSDALNRARRMPPAGVPLLAKPFSLADLQQTLEAVFAARASSTSGHGRRESPERSS